MLTEFRIKVKKDSSIWAQLILSGETVVY